MKLGIKDTALTLLNITYPAVFIPLLDGVATVKDRTGTIPDITATGTLTNAFDVLAKGFQWFGDNDITSIDAAMLSIMDTSVGNKRILISFWYESVNAPVGGSEWFIDCGGSNATNNAAGGFGIRLSTNGRPNFLWRWKVADGSGAGADISLQPTATPSYDVQHHILLDIDLGATVGGDIYVDGALNFSVAEFDTTDKADGFPAGLKLAIGAGLTGSLTLQTWMNSAPTVPSGSKTHSYFLARPPLTLNAAVIANDLYRAQGGQLVESLIG